MHRRRLAVGVKLTVGIALAAGLAHAGAADGQEARVRTDAGAVVGRAELEADVFRGIPFAAPPVGALRWRPPQPVKPWAAPLDASRFRNACPQPVQTAVPQSEDCLTLSVWAPRHARSAPVMVWIHGGAHRQGDISQPFYDGSAFARDGVVLVSINYRLGELGFFDHPALSAEARRLGEPAGNYGLMDQVAALNWVKRNISAFGGDPSNVTIFGESAGAVDVLHLLTIPSAKGLFSKAIVESGGAGRTLQGRSAKEREGEEVARRAGLSDAATLDQLRALPVDKVQPPAASLGFGPFLDGETISESPAAVIAAGRAARVPVIVGANSGEGSLMDSFALGPTAVFALTGGRAATAALYPEADDDKTLAKLAFRDALFVEPARRTARGLSQSGPTWLYHFAYIAQRTRAADPKALVRHGGEIPYVFDSWAKAAPGTPLAPQDKAVAEMTHAAWVRFAKTGDPSGPGLAWPPLKAGATPTLVVKDHTQVVDDPDGARLDHYARSAR